MEKSRPVKALEITEAQRELVQSFLATYNAIDAEFRSKLALGREVSFSRVLNDFSAKHPRRLDFEFLRTANELRNLLVHEPKRAYDYVAIPTTAMVTKLKDFRDRILNPERVWPKFRKNVETVAPTNSLAQVLRQIARRDFSQFPIYRENKFDGLLTENGITRWLAHHVTSELSIIELEDVLVDQVIPEEEKRRNWQFVSREETVEAVRELFAEKEFLEAVLITQSGNERESLLGIVTRWDIIR
jgi:predicted transcriptional regulator